MLTVVDLLTAVLNLAKTVCPIRTDCESVTWILQNTFRVYPINGWTWNIWDLFISQTMYRYTDE